MKQDVIKRTDLKEWVEGYMPLHIKIIIDKVNFQLKF
jgi:hypothetical protein